MSKRNLSPAPLPPAKRLHASGHDFAGESSVQSLSFDYFLYDELILSIFSHLSWVDLCRSQSTSRNWARLAGDNELWRDLYYIVYGRTRLRGSKGFFARLDGREVRPLPGYSKADQHRDWKWMFRISSNWKKGRCKVEDYTQSPQHPLSPSETHIILAGPLTITASSKLCERPSMTITGKPDQLYTIPFYDQPSHHGLISITALALDQSPPSSGHLSVACFISTGEFSTFEFIHTSAADPKRKYFYQPLRRTHRTNNIIQAAYYHPLVVTLSQSFSLSIYEVSSDGIRHMQTLSSFSSYQPSSLILSSPSSFHFKLVIAYATPVYPNHWSVGASEIIISKRSEISSSPLTNLLASSSFKDDSHSLTSLMTVRSVRTIRAFDLPSCWVDESALKGMQEQWGRKLLDIAGIQTDGKWVVLGPSQSPPSFSIVANASPDFHCPTDLQLYRLVLPQSNSISGSPPKLNFVRTLHGQTSPVSGLALADGRCVSFAENGSIWVWDLEGGTGAEVAAADEDILGPLIPNIKGTVSFDERQIVTAHRGNIVVRRFDI